MQEKTFTKTLRLRVKDKHAKFLLAQAREVNFCWNFVNDLSLKILQRERRFCSAYDLHPFTAGASKEGLSIGSVTVQAINEEFVKSRVQAKKAKLRWRVSSGPRRSLGWIPFKKSAIRIKDGKIVYGKKIISVWDSYGLADYTLGTGSFSEDAQGKWYFNVTVKLKESPESGKSVVGVDLGCKQAAVASNGKRCESKHYRSLEDKLGIAQRARQKKRIKAIHAKIKNRRKDELHKYTTSLVRDSGALFVGNVSSQAMSKTKLAKSSLDSGWGILRTLLEYKSHWAGIVCEEVNERFTTQTCSCCGQISPSSPRGRAGLGIRSWTCMSCGETHDRDLNAAINIAKRGEQEYLTSGLGIGL